MLVDQFTIDFLVFPKNSVFEYKFNSKVIQKIIHYFKKVTVTTLLQKYLITP